LKVSIITVCYNSSKSICDTIESVLKQNYRNIEYILIDGKSADNTVEIIKKYESIFRANGLEYVWISEKDDGIYDAINKGIKMATGDIVGILNSDDYYYDDHVLFDIVKEFDNQYIDCVYGNIIYIDSKKNDKITRRWVSEQFKTGLFEKSWTPGHPTFYCKKKLYDTYGLYRTDFKIAADVELMYRFLEKHCLKSLYIDRYMVIMRQGGVSNRGIMSTITITKEMQIAINENGGSFNIFKYLFYKCLKIKQFIKKRVAV